jgi:hypothetical protein
VLQLPEVIVQRLQVFAGHLEIGHDIYLWRLRYGCVLVPC